MRILSFFTIILLITSCNNSATTKEETKDTAKPGIQIPETPAIPDTIFTGFGTEPFWSVYVINNNKIVFHPADGPDVEVPHVAASVVDNNTNRYSASGTAATLELIITKKDCSDGMSEETHPYSVALSINKTKYAGCGRKGN